MKGLAKFGKGLIDFGKDLIDFGKDVFQRGKDIYNNVTSDDSEFKKSLDIIKKEAKDIKEVFSSADAAKVGKSISDTYKSFAENFKTNTNQLKMFDDNGFDEKQASAEQNLQQNENQTEEASKVRRMMRN